MAQAGFTPISLYFSSTASAVPTSGNLANGELALNTADMKLYAKNSAGVVTLLASNGSTGATVSSVSGTGTVNGLTLTGTVTTSGSLTLGGTLSLVSPPAIGSTTPNTGAFTTLAASGAVTLSGGTANGVTYLNGSKVLTSGSALSFNGAQLGVVNGAGSAILKLDGTSAPEIDFHSSGVIKSYIYAPSTSLQLNTVGSNPIIFLPNEVEGMRLNTTGLGIGTSSPSNKLSIYGDTIDTVSATIENNNAAGSVPSDKRLSLIMGGSSAFGISGWQNAGVVEGTSTGGLWLGAYNGVIKFATGASARTERARISAAGNLMLGTTTGTDRLTLASGAGVGAAAVFWANNVGAGGELYVGQGGSNEAYFFNRSNSFTAFGTNNTEKIRISAAGGYSVGTTSDPGAGAIYATGNITAFFSDKRLKTVSGKIQNALDKVGKLSGVYYKFNDTAKSFGYDSDEEHVGVIAQEVEAVLPQIVKAAPFDLDENNNSKSGQNYKTVQYDKLTPLLIEAINELQAKVKALEAK